MNSDFCVAIHALVYLNHEKTVISSSNLSKSISTNSARIRKIMAKLKTAEIIETQEGALGGYFFSKDSRDITLKQIANALNVKFAEINRFSGNTDADCTTALKVSDVMSEIISELDFLCNQNLENKTLFDISNEIFKDN